MREAVVLQHLCCLLACITGFISHALIWGGNVLLGKTYGKDHIFRSILKVLFFLLSILFWLALMAVFAKDFISDFTSKIFSLSFITGERLAYGFWDFIVAAIEMIGLVPISWALGKRIANRSEEKNDEKYKDEIDTILMGNPIFVEAFNKIKNNDRIRMVKIFRDGISFHTYVDLPPEQSAPLKITHGADSNWEAEKMLKNYEETALKQEGSVLYSYSKANDFLLYSDYGFEASETAMFDLCKWLCKYLEPRFATREYKKSWEYDQTITSGPTGYVVHNDRVTPTGSSSKKISASRSVILSGILYVQKNNEFKDSNSIPPTQNLKKW